MVEALRMQSAVHQQVGGVVGHRQAQVGRLALQHAGRQHQVGHHHRRMLVVEGEHVGGVVLAAKVVVQLPAFGVAHETHRDLGRRVQRGAQPALHTVPRQQRPQRGVGKLQRQLQGGAADHGFFPAPPAAS